MEITKPVHREYLPRKTKTVYYDNLPMLLQQEQMKNLQLDDVKDDEEDDSDFVVDMEDESNSDENEGDEGDDSDSMFEVSSEIKSNSNPYQPTQIRESNPREQNLSSQGKKTK